MPQGYFSSNSSPLFCIKNFPPFSKTIAIHRNMLLFLWLKINTKIFWHHISTQLLLHFLCTSWQQNSSKLFILTGNFSLPIFSWIQFSHPSTPLSTLQTSKLLLLRSLRNSTFANPSVSSQASSYWYFKWCSWSHSPHWNTFNLPFTTQCSTEFLPTSSSTSLSVSSAGFSLSPVSKSWSASGLRVLTSSFL